MSTDPAHSLGDSFEVAIGSQPTLIADRLWAQQIDAQDRLEDNWREIQDYFIQLMNWAGTETIQAEELTVIPGLDEIFALIDVKTNVESGAYDMLVVDCAPTAETLRLLSLPEIMNWYIERIFPVERKVVRAVRPIVSKMTTLPIAGDKVFAAVERLHRNLDDVKTILTDEKVSSVRLVVNPEKMVIAEARRTYTYLGLFGYRVDAVVVNRIIPEEVNDPYFGKWKDIQAEHLATVAESFEPVPILRARLFDREMVGVSLLEEMATEIYGNARCDGDPVPRRSHPGAQARRRVRVVHAPAVRLARRDGRPSPGRGAVHPRRLVQAEPDPAADVETHGGARGELRR